MSAESAWEDLNAALQDVTPPCAGHAAFIADSRTDEQRAECAVICARCPIADLCHHYAVASQVDAGYWAGVDRASRGRGRPRTSTTADRTVSGTQSSKGNIMTIKITAAQVERDFLPKLQSFQDQAAAVKAAAASARKAIQDDPMLSDLAKRGKLDALKAETRAQLDGVKAEQHAYENGLKATLEKQLRGTQPTDANSVLLRRDASDRVRKLNDKDEALAMLQDAIGNGDAEMAHALGQRARNATWLDVAEVYQGAFPDTADSAAALAHVEANTSGAAYNMANQLTYSAPLD